MNDREFYDVMRKRAQSVVRDAVRSLDDCGSHDGAMAPHVAREKIVKLRKLARHITALCDYVESQP